MPITQESVLQAGKLTMRDKETGEIRTYKPGDKVPASKEHPIPDAFADQFRLAGGGEARIKELESKIAEQEAELKRLRELTIKGAETGVIKTSPEQQFVKDASTQPPVRDTEVKEGGTEHSKVGDLKDGDATVGQPPKKDDKKK